MAKADPQRDRVYGWEGQWADWNSRAISLKRAREYVHWACGLYNLLPPAVKQHGGGAYAFSQGDLISFPLDQTNRGIAIHETAHYICDAIFGLDLEDHSPEWMAIYMWLLVEARIAPKVALTASARSAGIRWVKLWAVSPKRLARGQLTKKALKPPAREF